MQHHDAHAVPHALGDALHQFIFYIIVGHMAPPEQHVGAVQHLLGQALLGIIQRRQAHAEAGVLAQGVADHLVQAFGVNRAHLFIVALVPEFVPNRNLNAHGDHASFFLKLL